MESIPRAWQRIRYLRRGIGVRRTVSRVCRKVIAPVYRYETGYVVVRDVPERSSSDRLNEGGENRVDDCVVLDSLDDLRAVERYIPKSISISNVRSHLALDPGSVVILARHSGAGALGDGVVGYRTCRRGQFSAFWVEGRIADDVLFVVNTEVLPQYRGKRIQSRIRAATFEYCRRRGIRKICGHVSAHNRPSIVAVRGGQDRCSYRVCVRSWRALRFWHIIRTNQTRHRGVRMRPQGSMTLSSCTTGTPFRKGAEQGRKFGVPNGDWTSVDNQSVEALARGLMSRKALEKLFVAP